MKKTGVTGWMLTVGPAPLPIQPTAARQKKGALPPSFPKLRSSSPSSKLRRRAAVQAGLQGPHQSCEGWQRSAAFQKKKLHLHKGQRLSCEKDWLKGSLAEKHPPCSDAAGPCPSTATYSIGEKKWYLN